MGEQAWPLKLKYRQPGGILRRPGVDPPEGTRIYQLGLSSKIPKKGGNQGGVGKAGRRGVRWPKGVKQRRMLSCR